jgi:hypothetical protein
LQGLACACGVWVVIVCFLWLWHGAGPEAEPRGGEGGAPAAEPARV